MHKEKVSNPSHCAIYPPLPEDDKVKNDIETMSDLSFEWTKIVATTRECGCKTPESKKQECFKKFEDLENEKIQ